MSKDAYYLSDADGTVCLDRNNEPDVALDEYEVVAELNRLRVVVELAELMTGNQIRDLRNLQECARAALSHPAP